MLTRREWISQATAAVATATIPALLTRSSHAAAPAPDVAGNASLTAHAAARAVIVRTTLVVTVAIAVVGARRGGDAARQCDGAGPSQHDGYAFAFH